MADAHGKPVEGAQKGGPGKQRSLRGDEPIGLWKQRIDAARRHFGEVRRQREEFERALALQDGVPDWRQINTYSDALARTKYGDQTVPLSFRYAIWLQAMTTGKPPVIKYPRGAAGDEVFGPAMEELLLRCFIDSGALREHGQGIFDQAGFGSSCVWYGFHADLANMAQTEAAAEGVAETTQRAMMGDTKPSPGQDHAAAAKAMDAASTDPVNRVALPPEAQFGLAVGASEQDRAAMEEAAAPQHPAIKRREFWARRLRIGDWVIWDPTVSDIRDARWMARKVVMSYRDAKAFTGFTDGARKRIEPKDVDGKALESAGVATVLDESGNPMDSTENGGFTCWQVFDKMFSAVHYVAPDLDEYAEDSEDYPYNDPLTGEPAIPGFFPCVITAPMKHSMDKPVRTLGVPLIAPGYPLQREITRLHNFAMASVKRHSVRAYEIPEDLDPNTQAMLQEGRDGALIPRRQGIEPGKMVLPIQFQGEAYRIVDLIGNLTAEWASVMGFPLADLTSQPQADTATAEQLSVTAGRNQADFIIQVNEDDMARGVEILRAFLKIGLYPPEKIAALMGPGGEQIMEGWSASSLDGDHITLKSASRAQAEKVVRIKQLGDALGLASSFVDPKTQLPVYDASPIVEEILMALDIGKIQRITWTPEDLMLRAAMAGGAPGGGGNEPPNRGKGEGERSKGPPSPDKENTAARRERA